MSKTVIKVEQLSKVYQLGDFGTGTISRDLERYWARLWGKDDPFLKIGEVNDRTLVGKSDVVWSLKDLNFEIERGDAVGIIGRNGAGKSTLLKILSRITSPTTGSVKIKGRIASLLEVGTGFHPELTGRENIYLNGAILGMRKAEIKRKFDEIVDFSGVERYIDTPVKRFSSGMYVRLAFAVAAHLESEILIIDEVLAVGDAEFQKKCLGKMEEVGKSQGKTVLFVSHNMDAVKSLCNTAILLNNGELDFFGDLKTTIAKYLNNSGQPMLTSRLTEFPLSSQMVLELFEINKTTLYSHDNLDFQLRLRSSVVNLISSVALLIFDQFGQKISFFDLRSAELTSKSDKHTTVEIRGQLKALPLLPGNYTLALHIQSNLLYKDFSELLQFEVLQKNMTNNNLPYPLEVRGICEIDYSFKL